MSLQKDTSQIYNSRIIHTFIKFIENKYRHINIRTLLRTAGMESYQVYDENHWFTQGEVDRFYEVVKNMTGNDNIARKQEDMPPHRMQSALWGNMCSDLWARSRRMR